MTQVNTSSPQPRGALGLIFFILLMDIIGITILSPVAPYLVRIYSSEAIAVTMIPVMYAAAQFLAAPLMGKLGDRFGRRPVLLVSIVGQGLGYMLFGWGGSLSVLLTARVIGGITGGNMSTASAYIADISKPGERAKNFALIGIAWSLGLILGPALGAILGQISLQMPAFAAAGLSFVNVLLGIFLLPESLPHDRRETIPLSLGDINPIKSIAFMAKKPNLGWLLMVTGLFNFAFNGINSTGTLFFIQKFDAQPWQTGLLMMMAGLALAVVQFLLVQPLVKRFGEKRIAIASLWGQAVGDVAIFLAPVFWMVFPLNMVMSSLSGFTFPTLTTLNTNCVEPREVGLLMGVTTAIGSLMNIAGPLWAGAMYDHIMPGAPFWMGALVLIIAGFLLSRRDNLPVAYPVLVNPQNE
jgi:DHA1 family tetracycline resistance protein-like MFS transporter